ncbi:hypothetical protein F2P81_022650 [Scophthalmus maximus]|uniref:Uncharacterized protein n=1 Tax=Scophthalmus maximus TaxID=52904 RepID=A0A6A4RZS1_SCOMX|nr:hypothetical protein F2P81_022650 [Scophthalmus maximus]
MGGLRESGTFGLWLNVGNTLFSLDLNTTSFAWNSVVVFPRSQGVILAEHNVTVTKQRFEGQSSQNVLLVLRQSHDGNVISSPQPVHRTRIAAGTLIQFVCGILSSSIVIVRRSRTEIFLFAFAQSLFASEDLCAPLLGSEASLLAWPPDVHD